MNKLFKSLLISFGALILSYSQTFAANAKLSFSPSTLVLNSGVKNDASIRLDPGEKIIGVDLILSFDSSRVEITDIESTGTFSNVAYKKIDNENGSVYFSMYNSLGVYQEKSANIATVEFSPKTASGETTLGFIFELGNTKDTNVAATGGRDALASADVLTIRFVSSPSEQSNTNTQNGNANNPAVLSSDDTNETLFENTPLVGGEKIETKPVEGQSKDMAEEKNSSPREYVQKVLGANADNSETNTKSQILYFLLFLASGVIFGFLAGISYKKRALRSPHL